MEGLLPQLILLGINMPVMDGFEFLEELAGLDLDLTDKKVVLSSSQSASDKERAAKTSTAYLHKPLTPSEALQCHGVSSGESMWQWGESSALGILLPLEMTLPLRNAVFC